MEQFDNYLSNYPDRDNLQQTEDQVPIEWKVGDVILDLYEINEVFESGGMGLVYRAHHKNWNIDLAVKSPRAEYFKSQNDKDNFIRECETWIDLGLHPYIVSCHYVRTLGGIPRLFVEFVDGGSLKDWIDTHRLYEGRKEKALERILDVAIQSAWGLQYAHEQGLVHQDIKPANLMLTLDGTAKVTDFGIAKSRFKSGEELEDESRQNIRVSFGGMTQAYCSPEQAEAHAQVKAGIPKEQRTELTIKSDIWSWAVTVLEMFVGKPEWRYGQLAPIWMEDYQKTSSGYGEFLPIPETIVDLLRNCFQEEPDSRPTDMLEISNRIQEIYQTKTNKTYPHQLPKPVDLRAAELNNKALSFMDLDQPEKAMAAWERALKFDALHPEATYNLGLTKWRDAQITDETLRYRLQEVEESRPRDWLPTYLLAQVHLERGNGKAAKEILKSIQLTNAEREEVQKIKELADNPQYETWRVVRIFKDQKDFVPFAHMSANGRRLLSRSEDQKIKLWDVESGLCLRIFEGDTWNLSLLALNTDGRYALTSSNGNDIMLWDTKSGRCLRTLGECTGNTKQAIFSLDSRYALSVTHYTFGIWDIKSGNCLSTFEGHTDSIESVCLSTDGQYALSGSRDNTLKLWEVPSGRCIRTYMGHTGGVSSVCLSSDAQYALSGSWDKTLRVWDVENGRCLRSFITGHAYPPVGHVYLTTDMQYALSAGCNTLEIWEIASGRCLRTINGAPQWVIFIAPSKDGCYILWGSKGKTLIFGELNLCFDSQNAKYELSHIKTIKEIISHQEEYELTISQATQFIEDGSIIYAANQLRHALQIPGYSRDIHALKLWFNLYQCLPAKSLLTAWEVATLVGHTESVNSVCLSYDGRIALSGSWDKTLKMWEVPSGHCLHTFEGHTGGVNSVCMSYDGQYALSGSNDKTAKLWDLETGLCLQNFEGHYSGVSSVSMAIDSRLALTGSYDSTLKLWDVLSGRCLRTFNGHSGEVFSVCMSTNGSFAISGGTDNRIRIWDLVSGTCLENFKGSSDWGLGSGVKSVHLSLCGRNILSGSTDGLIKLWEISSGQCLITIMDQVEKNSVYLKADSHFALSGSNDKTLRLLELERSKCIHTFEGHSHDVHSICMSSDGRYALSGSFDKTIKVWMLNWELENKAPADWNEGARPYLEIFLIQKTPYAGMLPRDREPSEEEITLALTRHGTPTWTEEDFQRLLYTLGCAGYGWLRPEGVRRELEIMAKER